MKKIFSILFLLFILVGCSGESKEELCKIKLVEYQEGLAKDIEPIQEKINDLNDKILSGNYDMKITTELTEYSNKLIEIQNKYEKKKEALYEECRDVLELE